MATKSSVNPGFHHFINITKCFRPNGSTSSNTRSKNEEVRTMMDRTKNIRWYLLLLRG
jgi:hypothetical protein